MQTNTTFESTTELQSAITSHQSGEFDDAARHYLAVLQAEPDHALANHNFGALLVQQNQFEAGLPYLIKALEADPGCGQYWLSYVDALFRAGHRDAAKEVLAMARQQGLQGGDVDALAARLDDTPRQPAAKSLKRQPFAKENSMLVELFSAGRYQEAEELASSMTLNYPQYGFGWKVLGTVTPNSADALLPLQKAAVLLPNDFEVHYNLGLIQQELGMLADACVSYRRALQINPAYAQGHNNLGVTLHEMGLLDQAEACYRQAVSIDPDYVNALHNLGIVVQALGRAEEAEAIHRRTLSLKPDHAGAHCNLGTVLMGGGHIDAAIESFRRAMQIKPDLIVAHNNLILSMDLAEKIDSTELQAERYRWAEIHEAPVLQTGNHTNDCTAGRRLRIGYVSADFREHSASKVFGGMLTRYDRSQFEVYAYSSSMLKDDRYTELFKKNVTVWRNIAGLADQAVAKMIRDDSIDILVDLSGHTAGNRLLVFARRPAPIQITALGYAAGTGMRAMDVFFTDRVMVPADEQHYYREQVRYLPSALCLFTMESFPPVNALPALSSGCITFGFFNRIAKTSDSTYQTWAEILQAIPNSRLLLKTGELEDAKLRDRIVRHFTSAGIDAARIVTQGKTSWYQHMQAYHQVDIALDPFPHGGGVTALEGLMMGVPVITRRWPTLTGRISASVMTTLGLTDWIAETEQQYIELAIRKAADLQSLSELRRQLRGIFTSSILGDQAAYVRSVEQEYLKLWREWCAKNPVAKAQEG